MAREERILSNNGSAAVSGGFGALRSRSSKQKKAPQRGLGVAQLEKIIVEERWKMEALQSANAFADNYAPDPAESLTLRSPNVSPLSPSSTNLCIPQVHVMNHETSLQSPASGDRHGLWHSQVNFKSVPERSGHFQRCSSMVNVAAAPVISPSPVICFKLEPPSNQILHGNLTVQDTKMASMKKRSFSCLHGSCVDASKYPNASKSRLDESLPSCSGTRRLILKQGRTFTSNGPGLNGDFLTLAPPEAAFPDPDSTQKKPLAMNADITHLKSLPCQENPESRKEVPLGFFPISPGASPSSNSIDNGENGESIDLNLTL